MRVSAGPISQTARELDRSERCISLQCNQAGEQEIFSRDACGRAMKVIGRFCWCRWPRVMRFAVAAWGRQEVV